MKRVFLLLFVILAGLVLLGNRHAVFAETSSQCYSLYGPSGSEPSESALTSCLNSASDSDSRTINVIKPTGAIGSINSLISGGVTLILIVAGLVAFVYLLLGGIKWITSGGDSAQVEAARNQVIHAMIGIIVVLAAWGLIMLIQGATGACFGIGCTIELPVFT
ncbi:MAG: pilin [Candidatus Roizmanbacteria bacterium]|nr:pilin [Candidatus Roizmanbacteria bacterium]